MVKITSIVLLMGALVNAAAIPASEPATLAKRGNAEVIAEQFGDVPDFNVQITEPTSEGSRGDVPDDTDLSKDVIPEGNGNQPAFIASEDAAVASPVSDTDRLLFSSSLKTFLDAKRDKKPGSLDWSDDGCSKSPDFPSGFNFLDSCKRHDFGYRNFKKQNRFTDDNRKRIDDNFKNDLYKECSKYSGLVSFKGVACRRIAETYHAAVRAFGGL